MSSLLTRSTSDETSTFPRLSPADLFALRYIRDASLSPSGHLVAYCVSSTTQEHERFEIAIASVRGDNGHATSVIPNGISPRWSPDERWIAFIRDGRLRLAEANTLAVSEPLTPEAFTVHGAPSWSPDGARIVVSLLRREVRKVPRYITRRIFRAEAVGFTDDVTQRVCVVDRVNGTFRWLTNGEEGIESHPEWSPDGQHILFFATSVAVPLSAYSPRLMAIRVHDGVLVSVLDDRWFVTAARWLPCGQRIAISAARDSSLTIPSASLWVTDLHGNSEPRTPELNGSIGGMIHHDMPAWDLFGTNPIQVLDEELALIRVLIRRALETWRVTLSGKTIVEPVLTGQRSCIVLDASPATDVLVYAVSDLQSPTELWRATLRGDQEERLTHLNDQVLRRWPAMSIDHFSFGSADGFEIEAWFMSRADETKPMPTIMFIHGGPFASTGHAFRYDFHLLASNGFGVLFANFRGSAGYGDAFSRAIMGDWGARAFPDHMGAVDAAIERGLADPERLGVWGASHGGFATCWIVGHTSRFKAAVAEAAVTNFITLYYLTDGPEVFARDLGGRPHEIPDVYRACSPMTFAHRCATPTMLVHGEDDLRCPISEAEQFYRALHDAGCTTELVRVPGCDHLGDSCGPLSARQAQNEALLKWMRRFL